MYKRVSHPTTVTTLARIGALLCGGTVLWGCHQVTTNTHTSRMSWFGLLTIKPDTGIALRAVMLQDTIGAEEHVPVWVLYAIVNGTRPTLLHNEPGRYRIVVRGPDGQPAKSLGGAGPAVGLGPEFPMMLPSNGLLAQRQDLRCVNDAAYSPVPIAPTKDTCLAMYALTTPGRYQVVVEYFGPDVSPDSHSVAAARDRGRAPVSMARAVREGVYLADTVTFVVVGR